MIPPPVMSRVLSGHQKTSLDISSIRQDSTPLPAPTTSITRPLGILDIRDIVHCGIQTEWSSTMLSARILRIPGSPWS